MHPLERAGQSARASSAARPPQDQSRKKSGGRHHPTAAQFGAHQAMSTVQRGPEGPQATTFLSADEFDPDDTDAYIMQRAAELGLDTREALREVRATQKRRARLQALTVTAGEQGGGSAPAAPVAPAQPPMTGGLACPPGFAGALAAFIYSAAPRPVPDGRAKGRARARGVAEGRTSVPPGRVRCICERSFGRSRPGGRSRPPSDLGDANPGSSSDLQASSSQHRLPSGGPCPIFSTWPLSGARPGQGPIRRSGEFSNVRSGAFYCAIETSATAWLFIASIQLFTRRIARL